MIISQIELDQQLPTELPARIHYVCKSKTKAGNYQAKCSYLYNNHEYSGIVFAPDNEDWFEDLEPGTIIKTRCVKPGKHPDYPNDLKGDALRLAQQETLAPASSNPLATLPELLRQAANLIEELSVFVQQERQSQQISQPEQTIQIKPLTPKLKYRSHYEWVSIVEQILLTVPVFQKAFSSLMLNAYIESTFDDFWPGDIVELKGNKNSASRTRWKQVLTRTIPVLLQSGVIHRIQGTRYHYELTESTRSKITVNK